MLADLSSTVEKLRALKPVLRARFGVRGLSIFGSYARGEASAGSDLDLLVEFFPEARPTLFSLSELDEVLEASLGVKVDTVPESCINPRLAPYIRRDLVAV